MFTIQDVTEEDYAEMSAAASLARSFVQGVQSGNIKTLEQAVAEMERAAVIAEGLSDAPRWIVTGEGEIDVKATEARKRIGIDLDAMRDAFGGAEGL